MHDGQVAEADLRTGLRAVTSGAGRAGTEHGRGPAVNAVLEAVPMVSASAVAVEKKSDGGRERAHHWIARSGRSFVPRGYRSPIGQKGGSGYESAIPAPVGSRLENAGTGSRPHGRMTMVTPNPGAPDAAHGVRGSS
ncbi:hypothetical protein Aglo01_13850 [Actinokineospora globicatena]|nr:hypothetical protein Aglo01_13850 [Actinokineospora globicatena]GLW83736.1 hypothetical protein Aglo02_13760 [Actinokineospora globicatena]